MITESYAANNNIFFTHPKHDVVFIWMPDKGKVCWFNQNGDLQEGQEYEIYQIVGYINSGSWTISGPNKETVAGWLQDTLVTKP